MTAPERPVDDDSRDLGTRLFRALGGEAAEDKRRAEDADWRRRADELESRLRAAIARREARDAARPQ